MFGRIVRTTLLAAVLGTGVWGLVVMFVNPTPVQADWPYGCCTYTQDCKTGFVCNTPGTHGNPNTSCSESSPNYCDKM